MVMGSLFLSVGGLILPRLLFTDTLFTGTGRQNGNAFLFMKYQEGSFIPSLQAAT
jgi:hypothetical protein